MNKYNNNTQHTHFFEVFKSSSIVEEHETEAHAHILLTSDTN